MWSRHHYALPLVTLLVTLPTALLEVRKEIVNGEDSARRHAEALQHKLIRDNYDYETSTEDETTLTTAGYGHLRADRANRVIPDAVLNENLNKHLFDRINTPTNPSLNHPKYQTHRSRPTINRRPIYSSYPKTSYPVFNWEPDEVLGNHDLLTPFHGHSTVSQGWTAHSPSVYKAMDLPGQRSHHDDDTVVNKIFDEKTRNVHRHTSPFNAEYADAYIDGFGMERNNIVGPKLENSSANNQQDFNNTNKVNGYGNSEPNHKPRIGDQGVEYSMVPMMEETNTSLSSSINGVYMSRARDNSLIIQAPVDKRGTMNRPAGSGIPDHVISKTDLLYYIDDARLAPLEADVTKPTFHSDSAIDYKDSSSDIIIGDKQYKMLKLSDASDRRAGDLPFIQEEGEHAIAIVKDNEPFTEFRLSSGRLHMQASDLGDSSEESGFVDELEALHAASHLPKKCVNR